MSDSNTADNGLGTFLTQISSLILAVISFISGIYGFIKLFADKDSGLITLISLTVGILLLLGICLYYAALKQPQQQQDQWESAFMPLSAEQVQAREKNARNWHRMHRIAIAGLILIPILCMIGVAGWFYAQSLPPKHLIVLVADFDGPDAKSYRITETIINQLRQATQRYADVEIQALNKPITIQEGGSKLAETEGEKLKAAIVIWGWYGNTGENVPLSVNFEVLHPPKDFVQLGQDASGNIQNAQIADLKHFKLQTQLSNEMTYLSLFTLGMARYANGDWDGAIARFSEALDENQEISSSLNQSLVYFYRGYAYLSQNNLDRALEDYNQAIKLQPVQAEAYTNRAMIYSAKGDYSHALADVNQVLKLEPDNLLANNNRGLINVQIGEYDQAIADFNQALKLLPTTKNTSSALQKTGSELGSLNQNSSSTLVEILLFRELSDYIIYNNRGFAYLSKGDSDHALADFNQAITIHPDQIMAYLNRSAAYFVKHELDDALADLNQVVKLQPDFALTYLKRGGIYYFKGDSELALADLNQAIKLQPDSATFFSARGEIYATREDHAHAIADYSQAIKLQPNSINDYLQRAKSYRANGDDDRAFADYAQVLKTAPDNAIAYNDRGWTYVLKGDFDHAISDLDQALKLKPEEADFYDNRGFAYAGKGAYAQAIADYNQALKLNPKADFAYYDRGIAYRKINDPQKAIADFNKTLELSSDAKLRQDAEKQLQELGAS
jgi:tetratricopeptide (TPR) repeat protein